MAITQITVSFPTIDTPPTRSDPASWNTRSDTFLPQLATLGNTTLPAFGTQLNTMAADMDAAALTIDGLAASAAQSRDTAAAHASAATAAETAIDQALATVADETASTVAHAADTDAHPLVQERLAALINAAQDLAGQSARFIVDYGQPHLSDIDAHTELVTALETTITQALQLAGMASRAISGGRISLQGGSAAIPALSLGTGAGLYQTADNQLSVVINGSEVARFSASGLAVTGGSVSSL